MTELAVEAVIALAKAGIERCRNAKIFKEEAARIGQTLTVIVALAHKWTHLYHGDKVESLSQVHHAVEKVFLCMQVASLGENASWKARAYTKLSSGELLQNIGKAENDLNNIIAILHLEQANAIYGSLHGVKGDLADVKKEVAQVAKLLDKFGEQMLGSGDKAKTIQQAFDTVLKDCQEQTPEIGFTCDTETTAPNSSLSSSLDPPVKGAESEEEHIMDDDEESQPISLEQVQKKLSRQIIFKPPQSELRAITLDNSAIKFSSDSLLGSGGFAEVFQGTYKGQQVAIKRLKAEPRDVLHLSSAQIQQDINRLAAEALMMHRCSAHPNIVEVFGCTTSLTEVASPMIVMELMHMTLFDVLHQPNQSPLSFSRVLFLMKGVAGALEHLHLQGIVHRDVKSLNILVDKDLLIAKLSDFGEAKVKGLNTTRFRQSTIISTNSRQAGGAHIAGTRAYQAPELFSPVFVETSRVAEMFSFGVVVWECLTRKIPHDGLNEIMIFFLAVNQKDKPMLLVPSKHPTSLSDVDGAAWDTLKHTASACLSRNRSMRPTSSTVVAIWHNVECPKELDSFLPLQPMSKVQAHGVKETDSTSNNNNNISNSMVSIEPPPSEPPNIINNGNKQPGMHRKRKICIGSMVVVVVVVVAIIVVVAATLNSKEGGSKSPTEEIELPTESPTTKPPRTEQPAAESPTEEIKSPTTPPATELPTEAENKLPTEPPTEEEIKSPTEPPFPTSESPTQEVFKLPIQEIKLLASDGAAEDTFGWSVAIAADTMVIGAPEEYKDNDSGGSAYVYTRSSIGTAWTEQAKLTASDGAAGDSFGINVAIAGNTIVIGAWLDDTANGSNSGSAYVYTRSSGTDWTEQVKLTASDGAADDQFGGSVAIDGDTIVIGAAEPYKDNDSGGSAYVYTRSSGAVWMEQAKLLASDGFADHWFGYSVAIDADTIVIDQDDTDNGTKSGSAYVYTRSGSVWTAQAKLTASDGAVEDAFGSGVAIAGDTIVIGAIADDTEIGMDSGSAYVYTLSGTVWTQQTKLTASDGAADDRFGIRVAIDGGTIVIGAFYDGDNGSGSGSAYIFE